jgi:hypothetical protein
MQTAVRGSTVPENLHACQLRQTSDLHNSPHWTIHAAISTIATISSLRSPPRQPSCIKQVKAFIYSLPAIKRLHKNLDNQFERDEFVINQLKTLPHQSKILDAGCGSQRYKQYCDHLVYSAQDFGQYTTDEKK